MNLRPLLLTAAIGSFAISGAAQAATITYDTTLADPPGVYFGGGNANSNFTVASDGNLEIGLSAILRYAGPITPVGNVYNVPLGPTLVASKTGAAWGFDFSVNLNALGTSTDKLTGITTQLTLTDVAKGTTGSFDALLIPDNWQYGTSGLQQCPACTPGTNYAFQNSEALSFASVAAAFSDPFFDVNLDDTYFLTLQVFNSDQTLLGSNTIQINAGAGAAVPEPITLALFGAGLAGAVAMRRRRNGSKGGNAAMA